MLKCWQINKILFYFIIILKDFSYVYLGCIYLINNTIKNNTIVKYYSNLKHLFSILIYFQNAIYFSDAKAESSVTLSF